MNDDDTSSRGRRAENGQRRTCVSGQDLVDEVDGTVKTSSRHRQHETTQDGFQRSIASTRLPHAQEEREYNYVRNIQISLLVRPPVQQEALQAGYRPSKSLKSCIQLRQDCTSQRYHCLNSTTDQDVSHTADLRRAHRTREITRQESSIFPGTTGREVGQDFTPGQDHTDSGFKNSPTDSGYRQFEQELSPTEQALPQGYSLTRQVQGINLIEESIDQRPHLIEQATQQCSGERYEIVTSASSLKDCFYRYY